MWVRGMTRAGHSGCQGGLSPVQTQRGNDSCAQLPVVLPRLGQRVSHLEHALKSSSFSGKAGVVPRNVEKGGAALLALSL